MSCKGPLFTGSWSWMKSSARHTLSKKTSRKPHLRDVNLTENYAKHTFQAPCCCFESGLTKDLLLFRRINVSIDCVWIKYLISMRRKYIQLKDSTKWCSVCFCFMIVTRESDYPCVSFSMKCLTRTLSFVPRCT